MSTEQTAGQVTAATPSLDAILSAVQMIGGVAAPQFTPFIAMAVVLAKLAPEIYVDVMLFFSKAEPTQAEIDALTAKLSVLKNPNQLYL